MFYTCNCPNKWTELIDPNDKCAAHTQHYIRLDIINIACRLPWHKQRIRFETIRQRQKVKVLQSKSNFGIVRFIPIHYVFVYGNLQYWCKPMGHIELNSQKYGLYCIGVLTTMPMLYMELNRFRSYFRVGVRALSGCDYVGCGCLGCFLM